VLNTCTPIEITMTKPLPMTGSKINVLFYRDESETCGKSEACRATITSGKVYSSRDNHNMG
jgi:hypothetical protein